jgi:peptidoglycan hydrolase-like amidase
MTEQLYDSNWFGYLTAAGLPPDKDPPSLKSVLKLLIQSISDGAPGTVANVVTAVANAGTIPVTRGINNFVNSSAAAMTITLATAGATDGQLSTVRVYDFSAASETITWVGTENSTVSAPTTSAGSVTLPKTVTFQFNAATSKFRCIQSV